MSFRGKDSSSSRKNLSYSCKKTYNIGSWSSAKLFFSQRLGVHVMKLFLSLTMENNMMECLHPGKAFS